MGVHGLAGLIKRLGIEKDANNTVTLPPNSVFAIDGNGLIFHLFRLAYCQHRKNVLESFASSPSSGPLQSQLLLPAFTPLSLVHDVTTAYLSELTTVHGVHLRIYFDGPDQYMKRREKQRRRERRGEEWENVRQLCIHGILPEESESKHRSSARRQSREHDRRISSSLLGNGPNGDSASSGDNGTSEAELYLSSFPLSPLVMEQIERTILNFASIMNPVLPAGSVHIIQCDGEADAAVARASAMDVTGATYAVANDSDYLIYGFDDEGGGSPSLGETKYIRFDQVDQSSADFLRVGNALTRSDVSSCIGLPPRAMIELSILLGNDYTGPLIRHADSKKRKAFWESVRWYHPETVTDGSSETDKLPTESEMSRFDIGEIAEHIAEKVAGGCKLTSNIPELELAIRFSYALYSFGDIGEFQSEAISQVPEDASDDDSDDDFVEFPSLPRGFDISLAQRDYLDETDLSEAALMPLTAYMSESCKGMHYIEHRHLDAFRMMVDRMRNQNGQEMEPPQNKLQFIDIQALYVLEKCLLEAIGDNAELLPCQVFSHSTFHSCLESISYDDFPLDNEVVSKSEKAFLEEATSDFPGACADDEQENVKSPVLPIDQHKEDILHSVKTQRVTIIHGETGCGKSSRVPCFLLRAEPPEPTRTAPEVKMIVSQPRRIAAKALAERVRSCEPDLADKIGLRMGHGIREHETKDTRAWFVTTGYVVRLLANHPSWFDSHTHLIIDEVHERSIDTDILCLLCRRLLQSHPTIRLVLMSATMAAELYSQYFGSPEPPIHVGARRFPIKEYFVEDLSKLLSLSPKCSKLAKEVFDQSEKSKCLSAPSANVMEKLYNLAAQIAGSVGSQGSSVLIFVPGMSDIEAIIELIERLSVRGVDFLCLPIHSDVPFEEQMAAFEPPKQGEVKVIIATNAAESSLTLPDVDHVICLGLCKQIIYNKASHRQMLVPTWISRASATQRAGRTGRVREGNVYRLYSRNAFNKYMQPFDQGELVRCPLDNTILSLRDMLDEAVTPILLECLEPPDISTIERSFKSLHAANFISEAGDEGLITSLGSLVVALGIDLTLGSLVGLGIQFGVAAEAVQMAAILSFPKQPWAQTSPLFHDTETFNEIVSKTFSSRCFFDAGLYSEPMAVSNLLYDYSNCKDRASFCWKHRVSGTRMRHLYGTVESLKQRLSERLGISTEVLDMSDPPYQMHPSKLNILRILQTWLFHETMIVHSPPKQQLVCADGSISIKLDGPPVTKDHLAQIIDGKRHPYQIVNDGELGLQGLFQSTLNDFEGRKDFFDSFEIKFVSFALEKGIDIATYSVGAEHKFFIPAECWDTPGSKLRETIISNIPVNIKEVCFIQYVGGNQRGLRGRACGAWQPISVDSVLASEGNPTRRVYTLSSYFSKEGAKNVKQLIEKQIFNENPFVTSILSCKITERKKNNQLSMTGLGECPAVSRIDLSDLFACPDIVVHSSRSNMQQIIKFECVSSTGINGGSAVHRPLINDAPEGARLMSVLASERRRDNFIRFTNGSGGQGTGDEDIDVNLPKSLAVNGKRWKRKGGGGMCFVPENCVPVAAIPTNSLELFGCCANTLDLRGGACRVEGITLLPPGRFFVGLALLAFGVNPRTGAPINDIDSSEYYGEEKKDWDAVSATINDALNWIVEKDECCSYSQDHWRVVSALQFHEQCMEMGEQLKCQPDKIKALCELFDGVGGNEMTVWDGYDMSLKSAMGSKQPAKAAKRSGRVNRKAFQASFPESTRGNDMDGLNQPRLLKRSPAKGSSDSLVSTPMGSAVDASSSSKPLAAAEKKKLNKEQYACVGCNKMFSKWKKCVKHRDKCCPGVKFNRKKATTLARDLMNASNSVSQGNNDINEAMSEKGGDVVPETIIWVCPSCKEEFGTRKKCKSHLDKCLFGLVSHLEPLRQVRSASFRRP